MGLRTCPKPWPKHGPRPAANDVVVADDDGVAVDSDVVDAGHNTDIDDRCDGSIDDRAVTEAMQKDVELYLSNPNGVPDIDGIDGEAMDDDDYDEIDENMRVQWTFHRNTARPTLASAGIRPPSRAPRRRGKRKQSSGSQQQTRSSHRKWRHSAPADDEGDDDDEGEDKYVEMVTTMIFNHW